MRQLRHLIYRGAARRPNRAAATTTSDRQALAASTVDPRHPSAPARISSRTGAELAALLDRLWVA